MKAACVLGRRLFRASSLRPILAPAQNAAVVRRASLAIVNGMIWGSQQRATALAVVGERIAAIGTDNDVRSLGDGATRIGNSRGGPDRPAFHDSHIPFLIGSRALDKLEPSG